MTVEETLVRKIQHLTIMVHQAEQLGVMPEKGVIDAGRTLGRISRTLSARAVHGAIVAEFKKLRDAVAKLLPLAGSKAQFNALDEAINSMDAFLNERIRP